MTTQNTTTIPVANAPCSWGVLEFDLPGKALGYGQVLDEIRDTGYVGTEFGDWGFMPTEPSALRRELDARQLAMVGAFIPVAFVDKKAHDPGAEVAVRTAKLLAAVEGRSPFIVLADDNGKKRCVFHHHAAGFVETPDEIARLLELTDAKLVGLCFDTGHYRFGGGDPFAALRRHRDRIGHVHFKDCSPAVHQRSRAEGWDYFGSLQHGIFCELGKGGVDFATVTTELRRTNYADWIVVEQDVLPGMGAPKEFAQRNRDYLRALGI